MSKYVSPQDSTFHAFLKQANIPVNSRRANVLKAQMLTGGMPFIKTSDDANLRPWYETPVSTEFEPSGFTEGLFGKLHPSKWKQVRGSVPDTLHIRKGNMDDMLAELSHAIQYSKPQEIRDSLDWENSYQYKELGDYPRYKTPGTVEFQAHEEIEPILEEEYDKAKLKDKKDAIIDSISKNKGLLDYVRSLF